MGNLAGHCERFPLLLKFLDVAKKLSVQVHPSDAYKELIPAGDTGKTEAWVVLEKGPEARIYAGLKPTATADVLRRGDRQRDCGRPVGQLRARISATRVLIRAGTVHSLSDVVVFEVQENSDVTFRLYDWDHIDPQTGQRRPLQVDQAMACINFKQGAISPLRHRCDESKPLSFGKSSFVAIISGCGESVENFPSQWVLRKPAACWYASRARVSWSTPASIIPSAQGDVLLLPAVVGACSCRPNGTVTLLEISLPEIS